MIRILHTADVHLDSPLRSLALRNPALQDMVETATRTAFSRIVETAVTEKVAALLIAGDLFDGAARSARTAAFLMGAFERLGQAGIRVFYIKGNHDAENPVTGVMDFPAHVHVFDGRGGKVALGDEIWIHGVSFKERTAPESLLPKFGAPVAGAVNIAMLHTSLAGAEGHDVYAPCTISELSALGFDYWALGHVHKRQVHGTAPWIVMPGTPQGRDIGEPGARTATLLEIDGGAITTREVPTAAVAFHHCVADVAGVTHDEALAAAIRAALRATAAVCGATNGIVRLFLRGETPRHWQILRDRDIWHQRASDLAEETGTLWLEKLVIEVSPPAEAQEAGGEGAGPGPGPGLGTAIGELEALMATIREEPAYPATAMAQAAVLNELPSAVRARLLPDEAASERLILQLAAEGAGAVLARLRGAEG